MSDHLIIAAGNRETVQVLTLLQEGGGWSQCHQSNSKGSYSVDLIYWEKCIELVKDALKAGDESFL